ncbi:MAG: lamin tail domain-containing protein [Lewinellaceae bacterium]|nr:lamin tail domain-containing protein [Lewinellaceae bacterium]
MNNNILGQSNNDINISNGNIPGDPTPCGLVAGNSAAYLGCPNIVAVGPGADIPANSLVVLQTSTGAASSIYNFSALCGSGQCLYVLSNSCSRSSGAFTNAGSGSRTANFSIAGGCNQAITYDRALLSGGNGAYFLPLTNVYGNNGCVAPPVTPASVPNDMQIQTSAKVFLQGPYVSADQLMHDSLRVQNLLPLQEPYTDLTGFTHIGGGGNEQTTAPVLVATGPNAIVDWVFLELRSADTPAQVVATRSALVQRDGDVVDVDGSSPVIFGASANQEYFLAVRHRNHLGAQFGDESLYPVCGITEKDFTTLPPEGFYSYNGLSAAQRIISGRYTLWAGNGRIDPQLKYNGSNNDRNAILSVVGLLTPNAVVTGYRLQDYNLDGQVKYNGSANDRNVLLGNVGDFNAVGYRGGAGGAVNQPKQSNKSKTKMKHNLPLRAARKYTGLFSGTLLCLVLFSASVHGQSVPVSFPFDPNLSGIQSTLAGAPLESDAGAWLLAPVIELRDPYGAPLVLRALETRMLAPDLAAQFPDFKTYSLTDPASGVYRGQLFVSRFGVQGLIFSDAGTFVLRPLDRNNPTLHEAYLEDVEPVDCLGDLDANTGKKGNSGAESLLPPNGANKRTYRMAIVTTGEYFQANGNTVPLATAAVTTDVNNLSAIYKRELAVDFTLITPVHYTDPATDPFDPTTGNGVNLALQAAAVVGQNFNNNNYDIGHALHTGGTGGIAYLGVVCSNSMFPTPPGYNTGGPLKAGGFSGSFSNQNLGFARLFGHEVGHMFNARHTFNGTGGSCTANIDGSSSYEIGSGTTIMSYRGGCGSGQNVPSGGTADDYFHSKSLEQMLAYIAGVGGSCPVTVSSGNQVPSVTANPCGGSLTIPRRTPFTLTGSGSDPDGDPVYYTWEQIDEDGAGTPTQGFIDTTAGNSSIAPLFRTYPPNTEGFSRTFPALSFILNNANVAVFEALPNVARTINMRLQARDFKPFGAVNNSDVAITVNGSTGPLSVTAPNSNVTWAEGSTQTVTWDVNNTNTLSANVNILLSIDGGNNYPFVLVANTPNDGSQNVTLPSNMPATTQARIKVECRVNDCLSFFDVGNVNFTITSNCLAFSNNISPVTPVALPQNDPGLNLDFVVLRGTPSASATFNVTISDPDMDLVRWNNAFTSCITPGGTAQYQVFPFVANTSGQYGFNFGNGNFRAVHLFETDFDPNGGCTNFVASSVQEGAGYYSGIANGANLTAGTVYFLIGTNEAFSGNTTATFSGPGAVNEVLAFSGDYAYTFVAVNTANDAIVAVSADADFTNLFPGDFRIYGVMYKAAGAPPPPVVDPNDFIGETISDILSAGNCVYFSNNFRPLTVTGPPPSLVINEVDYEQPGADDAEFIELKNVSLAAINLSGWTVELVNGNAGGATVYQTIVLPNVSLPAGDYFVICGNSGQVPNCDLVVSPGTDLIQDGAPDAIGLRKNGELVDAVSYEGNTGSPYTEDTGVSPGDSGNTIGLGVSRFPDGSDINDNSTDFLSNVCISPGESNANSAGLVILTTITPVSCNGDADGSVALNVSGAGAPYDYLWSNGQTTATITNLSPGTYTVTVTGAYGCSATASATVTEPAVFTASAGATDVSCFGNSDGTATANVSGGTAPYSYLWSNGQTTVTAINLTAGTYTVTATDDNGCLATAMATVNQPPALIASTSKTDVSCPGGSNGTATVMASGGTPPYSYLWSNGQTTATATGLSAGTYTVTVTDKKYLSFTYTGPIAVPDNSCSNGYDNAGETLPLTVSGVGLIGPQAARLDSIRLNMTTTWAADMNLWLQAPSSEVLELSTGNGGSGDNYLNTIFRDSAPLFITSGAPPYTGTFKPEGRNNTIANAPANGNPLGTYTLANTFSGINGDGDWKLRVCDAAGNDLAAIQNWTLYFTIDCSETTATAVIGQPPVLAIGVSTTSTSCNGGSNGTATANPSGGTAPYGYLWSNGQTTATAVNLTAGTYTVTTTDANGCSATATATVTQPAPMVIGTTVIGATCFGEADGAITLNVSNGVPPYSYLWNNGQTTATAVNLAAGTYTATVTDDEGCSATVTETVPEPAAFVLQMSVIPVSCFGETDGAATLLVSGGTMPYGYLWSNGQTTATAVNLTAGTYTVTTTDDNGCAATATATVTQPVALGLSTSATPVSCNGGSNGTATANASGGTMPYGYLWSNGQTTATATNLSAGTYTVTTTDANGCSAIATATITQPAALGLSTSATPVSCNGGSNGTATANASGGTMPYGYSWSDGQTTATATNLSAGTYTVTTTDANGCSAIATATVTQPAALGLSTSATPVSCHGGSNGTATANASGGTMPYGYLWSNGQTTATATNLSAGTYTVTTTDANGCSAIATATVTQPAALGLSTSATPVSCNGGSNGTATANASGGTMPYGYCGATAKRRPRPNLSAGTYTVTTRTRTVLGDATATVTQPAALGLSTSATPVSCNGGSTGRPRRMPRRHHAVHLFVE